jgi:hypothetical protein
MSTTTRPGRPPLKRSDDREPMLAGMSTDQSQSAELNPPAGVDEFTFPRQPHEAIPFTGAPLMRRIVIKPTIIDQLRSR